MLSRDPLGRTYRKNVTSTLPRFRPYVWGAEDLFAKCRVLTGTFQWATGYLSTDRTFALVLHFLESMSTRILRESKEARCAGSLTILCLRGR